MENTIEQLMYPIGRFSPLTNYTSENLKSWIAGIKSAPVLLCESISNLDDAQLNTPYRPEGWSVIQVVHHVADSHINAYVRLKLALTEEKPTISPYEEKIWAALPDVQNVPVSVSITLLTALHERWVMLLTYLDDEDWRRTYYHPANKNDTEIWQMTNQYDWHGRHHIAQIKSLRERMKWY